jgi:hypothetical protein
MPHSARTTAFAVAMVLSVLAWFAGGTAPSSTRPGLPPDHGPRLAQRSLIQQPGLAPGLDWRPLAAMDPEPGLSKKQLKKLSKLAKKHAKRAATVQTAHVDHFVAATALEAASAVLAELEADERSTPKQLKKAKYAIKKATKALKAAKKKEKTSGQKLEAVRANILGLDPDFFEQSEPLLGTPIDTPVLVQEALPAGAQGEDRTAAVATFGLPFSQQQAVPVIAGRPGLAVVGSNLYQFRVLDTWPEGTARWVLCDIATDVQAGSIRGGMTVVSGVGASNQAPLATLSNKKILLDTGVLQVIVRTKKFNLFDSVTLGGKLVGLSGGLAGVTGRGAGGEPLTPTQTVVVIEENGPARAVVRADGVLEQPGGKNVLPFTCRITARRGSAQLEVTFTVRNSSFGLAQHTVVQSIELSTDLKLTGERRATVAGHAGETKGLLAPNQTSYANIFQAYTVGTTSGAEGAQFLPHLKKSPGAGLDFDHEGYQVVLDGQLVQALGEKKEFPTHGYLNLRGKNAGVTVGIRNMQAMWPASLQALGNGTVSAGIFPDLNPDPYTFAWRQHESRSVMFAFHGPDSVEPGVEAARFDYPVSGRAADYGHYDRAGVFPYELLTSAEHEQALALMGIDHAIVPKNASLIVTRYLYKGTTGGTNNNASIENSLGGAWLRYGLGGSYLNALDLALYKSEWQIQRSTDFPDALDPGPGNNVPHSTGFAGDDEHRYREGIILAYYLTGDPRYAGAMFDEAEVLHDISVWPHERSMYQTLRAMAYVAEFTGDNTLTNIMKARLNYFLSPTVDVDHATSGFGWETAPGVGQRGYYVNSSDNKNEKPPGENFQGRGFISASLGPLALFHVARVLPDSDPIQAAVRNRLKDLALWTREELFPGHPDPAQMRLAYSYAVSLKQVTKWENVDFHPILMGMAEAYRDTGDIAFLKKGYQQLRAAEAHGDLYRWNTRLDVQHFLSVVRDLILGL